MTRRSWALVAPETEATWQRLPSEVLDVIRQSDAEALAAQRASISPEAAAKIEEATYTLKNRFRYWEEMVRSLESAWLPRGRYFIDEYINNLDSRDSIDRIVAALPSFIEEALRPLLRELDQRYHQHTEFDGGEELKPWVSRIRNGALLNDRWYRKPLVIPWS